MSNTYKASDIAVLTEIEHVQLNPSMYIRKTEDDEPSHLVEECLDNALDEAQAGYANIIAVSIDTKTHECSVIDNGRGIPLEKDTPVIISTKLFSGAKFQDRKTAYKINSGLHGIGLVAVLALSDEYELNIYRNEKYGNFTFKNAKLKSTTLKPFKGTPDYSTKISFKPSSKYFDNLTPDINRIRMRLITASVGLPNCTFVLIVDDNKEIIKLTKEEAIKQYCLSPADKEKTKIIEIESIKGPEKFKVSFVYSFSGANTPKYISSINLLPVHSGGTHINVFNDILKQFFEAKAKKNNIKVLANDCIVGLRVYFDLSLVKPQFAGQAKEKLTVKKTYFDSFIPQLKENLEKYFLNNKEELIKILTFFEDFRKGIDAKRISNGKSRKRGFKSFIKLRDCSSPRGELFIVEGDSAAGGIIQSRNPARHAVFPLKGKIPLAITAKDILKNKEIGELIMALGTGVHQEFNIKNLRYSKIICATDADPDGGHISCLLMVAFAMIVPEVIKQGRFFLAQTPLYAITGKNTFIPLWNEKELQEAQKNNEHISRYKGLGELDPKNLKVCLLDPKARNLYQVNWTKNLDDIILLFSNVETKRKLLDLKFT